MPDTKITFDLLNGRIVIEGGASSILDLLKEVKLVAPKLSEVRIISGLESRSPHEQPRSVSPGGSSTRKPSIREFSKPLPLVNTYERIAALAYHANKIEEKPTFTVKDVDGWFSLCGFRKPKLMKQALADARGKYGYVESKGRDQWVLANGGENKILDYLEKKEKE